MVRRKQAGRSSEWNHAQTNREAGDSEGVRLKPSAGFKTSAKHSRKTLS